MNILESIFGKPSPKISAVELAEKTRGGERPLILDVRQPEEYQAGHIAGAKLIPLGELSRRAKELPKNREIICVCQSGSRSSSAVRFLAAEGYQVVNMSGGMLAWRYAQLPIKKGNGA